MGSALYFVGIIDILQDYNLRKQFAHTMKTTFGGVNVAELSTVPPDVYAQRFSQFLLEQCLARLKDVQWNFFMDPRRSAGAALPRDDAITAGDVVGCTHGDTLTLDIQGLVSLSKSKTEPGPEGIFEV